MRGILVYILSLLLLVIAVGTVIVVTQFNPSAISSRAPVPDDVQYLAADEKPGAAAGKFNVSEIPGWLFTHVGVIAGFQVIALIAAARVASRPRFKRSETKVVQFLVEIPMYLGLFGTLMGVCLTQFIAGSLVAPLAYLTTMSGILLHVLGKLFILLPLPDYTEVSE